MKARIFQPPKTATQSGAARTKEWRLEFDPAAARYVEPLMGWTGSRNTMGQISMSFPDKDSAVAFAVKHRLAYEVEEPPPKRPQRKSYADNFAFRRQN